MSSLRRGASVRRLVFLLMVIVHWAIGDVQFIGQQSLIFLVFAATLFWHWSTSVLLHPFAQMSVHLVAAVVLEAAELAEAAK